MQALRHWLLLLFATSGVAAALIFAQLSIADLDLHFDATPDRRYTLSEHGRRVLQGLTSDVRITQFVRSGDPRNPDIDELLERIAGASSRVATRRLDLDRNPAVARDYGIDNYAGTVVESGMRRRVFAHPNETLLVSAILQVTRPERPVLYTVVGHGEADFQSPDRHSGYSVALRALSQERYEVRSLQLTRGPVPSDAAVVVVAAPQRDFLPQEIDVLGAYIERGGALFVLAEPRQFAHLDEWLGGFGVQLGRGVIVDPDSRLLAGDLLTSVIRDRARQHPITAAMAAPPLFSGMRTVAFVRPQGRAVRGIELIHTTKSSWNEEDIEAARNGLATAAGASPGAQPVGVAAVVGQSDASAPPARLVVLGDADFANNFFIDNLGNKDLWLNTIDWLAGEDVFLASRPQERVVGVNQFFLPDDEGRRLFWLGSVIEPGAVLCVGLIVYGWRRRL